MTAALISQAAASWARRRFSRQPTDDLIRGASASGWPSTGASRVRIWVNLARRRGSGAKGVMMSRRYTTGCARVLLSSRLRSAAK